MSHHSSRWWWRGMMMGCRRCHSRVVSHASSAIVVLRDAIERETRPMNTNTTTTNTSSARDRPRFGRTRVDEWIDRDAPSHRIDRSDRSFHPIDPSIHRSIDPSMGRGRVGGSCSWITSYMTRLYMYIVCINIPRMMHAARGTHARWPGPCRPRVDGRGRGVVYIILLEYFTPKYMSIVFPSIIYKTSHNST